MLRAQSLPRSRSVAAPASPARRLRTRGLRPAAASGGVQREALTRQQRTKLDSGPDREFYAFPRARPRSLLQSADEGVFF